MDKCGFYQTIAKTLTPLLSFPLFLIDLSVPCVLLTSLHQFQSQQPSRLAKSSSRIPLPCYFLLCSSSYSYSSSSLPRTACTAAPAAVSGSGSTCHPCVHTLLHTRATISYKSAALLSFCSPIRVPDPNILYLPHRLLLSCID